MKSNTFALDAGVAGGLLAALLVVYVIDAASRHPSGPVGPEAKALRAHVRTYLAR